MDMYQCSEEGKPAGYIDVLLRSALRDQSKCSWQGRISCVRNGREMENHRVELCTSSSRVRWRRGVRSIFLS